VPSSFSAIAREIRTAELHVRFTARVPREPGAGERIERRVAGFFERTSRQEGTGARQRGARGIGRASESFEQQDGAT